MLIYSIHRPTFLYLFRSIDIFICYKTHFLILSQKSNIFATEPTPHPMKPIASLLASFCSPSTLWHAPDSHAGKYHHLSPWTFCAANPIRYSDPTGKDIYVFDQKGYIVDCISIDNFDQIRVMDNCMNITESAKMHKGTIQVNGPSDRKESRYKNP